MVRDRGIFARSSGEEEDRGNGYQPVELEQIFSPRSIAFFGASGGFEKAGTRFLMSHQGCGFSGPLYAVNPKGLPVEGLPTYKSLLDIPGPVDYAYIVVPAKAVPETIKACAAKGVRAVTVFSSGFREVGTPEGLALEQEVAAIGKAHGVRIIGPNCMGIYCPASQLSYRLDFPMIRGPVSLVSQSGGMAISSIITAGERGFGFEKAVSFGNECDITAAELISHYGEDPGTEVIMAYIEGPKEPGQLISNMELAGRKKPVVVLKGGVSKAGRRAANSHTGALAGSQSSWQAALRSANAVIVDDFEAFIDMPLAFQRVKRPIGNRLAIVSISGGFCVMLTDRAVKKGFEVPQVSERTEAVLKESFNAVGSSVSNPLDLAMGFFSFQNFEIMFSALDKDENTDAILFQISMEYITLVESRRPGFLETMAAAIAEACRKVKKSFLLAVLHTHRDHDRQRFVQPLVEAGLAVYPTVDRALDALVKLKRYYDVRDRRASMQ